MSLIVLIFEQTPNNFTKKCSNSIYLHKITIHLYVQDREKKEPKK